MNKDAIDSWAAGFKPKYPLGYSQYQLSYIVGHAQGIQKQAVQLEMIWANREAFKSGIDVQEAVTIKVEEIKKLIEHFEGYLEPTKEDGE